MTRRRTCSPASPAPSPTPDGLDAPFWDGLRAETVAAAALRRVRRLAVGTGVVLPPLPLVRPALRGDRRPRGVIYSHERVWHPVHPALAEQGPYVVVLVELPAGRRRAASSATCSAIRAQPLDIGAPVTGVFEHHDDAEPPFTLLQWTRAT